MQTEFLKHFTKEASALTQELHAEIEIPRIDNLLGDIKVRFLDETMDLYHMNNVSFLPKMWIIRMM